MSIQHVWHSEAADQEAWSCECGGRVESNKIESERIGRVEVQIVSESGAARQTYLHREDQGGMRNACTRCDRVERDDCSGRCLA